MDGFGVEGLMGVDRTVVNDLGIWGFVDGEIGKDDGGMDKGLKIEDEGEGKVVESRRKDEQNDMVTVVDDGGRRRRVVVALGGYCDLGLSFGEGFGGRLFGLSRK